jgi:competence protein CoiA
MSQVALTCDGQVLYAATISNEKWESLKINSKLGDFLMPCCKAPAVLKTSINGLPFFSHLSVECDTSPETTWHKTGKAAIMTVLSGWGVPCQDEAHGQAPDRSKWKADVLFSSSGRTISIELQRSYQNLRDYTRRHQRYAASGVECFWLVRKEGFLTLGKATARLLLKRDFGGVFPSGGIGTGMLPELPVAILDMEIERSIIFGGLKSATISDWLEGVVAGTYKYRGGSWNLD